MFAVVTIKNLLKLREYVLPSPKIPFPHSLRGFDEVLHYEV